ncbi:helix-turn-helix domain-containing protein [Propioniciclava sp. MC1595]|uniref:MerR family transcriptional regulator n=1 Tax=Propioniciclava sp. MC1595 TaxID=2760308 RepID=UPI00166284D5|nr:helix-turn-helix domain-containing protein [Propioniciclava sp. MC1595]MBB1495559.1 helix-turn-helix domain-containing protein [Propioniciclava sp. MC1595]QTE25642.1 helix-turn-helix domain-containing protein [Propioniciclava sp. MC1595]
MTTATARNQETWLSVQEASAMLGVSPATLRRWSANGEVEAFTTPGGHRRFSLSTLKALLQQGTGDVSRPGSLGESADRVVKVMRRHARAASNALPESVLDDGFRAEMASLGRDLTTLLLAHLDAETPARSARAIAEAEAMAAEHARVALRAGALLTEVVGVFVRFRGLFVEELADAAVRHGLTSGEATSLVNRGGAAVDRALAAFVAAWEERAD